MFTPRTKKLKDERANPPLISPNTKQKFRAARRSYEENTQKLNFSHEKLLENAFYLKLIKATRKTAFTRCLKVLDSDFCDVLLEPNIIEFVKKMKLNFEQICTTSYRSVLECKYGKELIERQTTKNNLSIATLNAKFEKESRIATLNAELEKESFRTAIADKYSEILFKSYKGEDRSNPEYSLENLQTNLNKELTAKNLSYNEVKEFVFKKFISKLAEDFRKKDSNGIYENCCKLIKDAEKTPLDKQDSDFWQNVYSKIIDVITSTDCSVKHSSSDPIPRRKPVVTHFGAQATQYRFNSLRQLTILNALFNIKQCEITATA